MDKRAKSKLLVSSLVAMEAEEKKREIEKGEWLFAVGFKMKRCLQVFIYKKKLEAPLVNFLKTYIKL